MAPVKIPTENKSVVLKSNMQTAVFSERCGEYASETKPFGGRKTGLSKQDVGAQISNLLESGFKYSK